MDRPYRLSIRYSFSRTRQPIQYEQGPKQKTIIMGELIRNIVSYALVVGHLLSGEDKMKEDSHKVCRYCGIEFVGGIGWDLSACRDCSKR